MNDGRSMNDDEYQLMAEVEAFHWWYRGLRDLLGRVLQQQGLVERTGLRVLDAGCGTGANLQFLGERLDTEYLGGFDISPLAIDLARRKIPRADLHWGDLRDPPLRLDQYDLILSCDVVCTIGMSRARPGMRKLAGQLREGGLLVMNLPAYRWLFSAHDRAVGTRERTTARELRTYLRELNLTVVLVTYRLFTLFPAVLAARLPSMLWQRRDGSTVHSDLHRPNPLVNRCLTRALKMENAWIARGFRLPWGSSVFAVAQRT